MRSTRAGRVAVWLVGVLPARVRSTYLANPERGLVSLACILIGVQGLLSVIIPHEENNPTPLQDWPVWLHYEWAIAMMVGGSLALLAQWTGSRPAVRFSAGTLCIECWLYAGQVLADLGTRGAITATIFFALGAAKAARVLLSLAATERLIAHWREDHPSAEGD